MSLEAVKAFRKNPVSFMRSNIVFPNLEEPSGRYWFTLEEMRDGASRWDGVSVARYALVRGEPNEPSSFEAFWCDYRENQTRQVTVSDGADYLFTASMSGCSVGVGSLTPDGKRLVSHVNCARIGFLVAEHTGEGLAGEWKGRMIQRMLQARSIRQVHGNDNGVQVVGPTQYRTDPKTGGQLLDSTTFGVRDRFTNDWAFYVQKRYDVDTLVGVVFVAGVKPYKFAIDSPCILM